MYFHTKGAAPKQSLSCFSPVDIFSVYVLWDRIPLAMSLKVAVGPVQAGSGFEAQRADLSLLFRHQLNGGAGNHPLRPRSPQLHGCPVSLHQLS